MKYKITSKVSQNPLLITAIIVAILIITGFLTNWLVKLADRQIHESLLYESDMLKESINVEYLSYLRGDSSDLKSPYYHILKEQLGAVKKHNEKYRFIYLLGQKPSGEVFFFLDNEADGSPDESIAGQIYSEASDELKNVFKTGLSTTEGPLEDKWGVFVSAFSPVFHPHTKQVFAVLGIDIDSDIRNQILIQTALPPLIVMLALIVLVLIAPGLFARRDSEGIHAPIWLQYLEAIFVIIVGVLITLFIAHESYMIEHRANHLNFKRLAQSRTNAVAESLLDIKNYELESMARFFGSADFVRQDEFDFFTRFLLRNPNIQAWNWDQVVRKEEINQYYEFQKKAGIIPFKIWEKDKNGNKIPVRERDVYYPITFISPRETNKVALGYDAASESVRKKNIDKAINSNERITCSDPITLVQDSSEHHALLIVRPVYKNGNSSFLKGFAVAVLKSSKLLFNSVSDISGTPLEFGIVNPDGTYHQLSSTYSSSNHLNPDFKLSRYVFAFGRVFAVTARVEENSLMFSMYRNVWVTIIAGLILTFSFAFVLWFFVRNRLNLEKLVNKKTEELIKSEIRFKIITEQLAELIVIINNKGIIEYASPAAAKIVGVESGEFQGKHYTDFLVKDDIKKTLKAFVELYDKHTNVLNLEVKMKRIDGSNFYADVSGTPFNVESGNAILLTIRDMTVRKLAEEEIIRAKVKAEESDMLKTRFLINMSHEIRTPMNGIMGFLELLKNLDLSMEERSMYISFLNKSGQRLLDTINDIIEMSKIETGKQEAQLETVNLNSIIKELNQDLINKTLEKNLMYYCVVPEDSEVKQVYTDRHKLLIILKNILLNAVKFTTKGSVEFGYKKEGDYLIFHVKDTGIGIPPDRYEAVFDRFVQANQAITRPHEGSGLGLSIAKAYAELLGGYIRFESEENVGSTFFVYLPFEK